MILSALTPAIALDGTPPPIDNANPGAKVLAFPTDETEPGAPRSKAAQDEATQETLCLIIESAAKTNNLPLEFFIRVIWQESRFQPKAVGPITRNGQRAEGIAQFMPETASERRLLDPFDPVQALPKSAEFLSELRNQFRNLGLAAAAYNAGPRRVRDGWQGPAAYRRRPAVTSPLLPAPPSMIGPSPRKMGGCSTPNRTIVAPTY
jgi:soluble lytic murein transglycosylase-like protein